MPNFRSRPLRRTVLLGAVLSVAAAAGAARPWSTPEAPLEATEARRHTKLVKSVPAKDSTVSASPEALQLWFNEKIELSISKVQLVGPDQKAVPLAAITRDDSKKDSPVVARLVTDLADGAYVVNWTAASADGHAVKGSYRFFVKSR